jgi:hypothetical protein
MNSSEHERQRLDLELHLNWVHLELINIWGCFEWTMDLVFKDLHFEFIFDLDKVEQIATRQEYKEREMGTQ